MIKSKAKQVITAFRYNGFIAQKRLYDINNIFTHLTNEEKLKLYELASLKSGIFVEIGSYLGASSSFIALAISEKRENATLYCIDTWQNDAMSAGKKDTYEAFQQNTLRFERFITPLCGNSVDVAKVFDKKIDFLFIDGDHSYEGVKADWNSWSPKLNKGAIVVFHDTSWAKGVQKVIEEDISLLVEKEKRLPNMYWAWLK